MTEQHDLGLSHDLPLLISRRRALGLIAGGLGATALAARGGDSGGGTTKKKTDTAEIPEETAGPLTKPSPTRTTCAASRSRTSRARSSSRASARPPTRAAGRTCTSRSMFCDAVYATAGYEQSVQNLAQTSLDTDMVFSDGNSSQLASWSGSPDDGIALKLDVRV
jgi:hypothetical protein